MTTIRNISVLFITMTTAIVGSSHAFAASLASVEKIPCDHLTVDFNSKQKWYGEGEPFGIPYKEWTVILFAALKARISQCGNPDGQGLISYLEYSAGNPIAEREAEEDHTKELLDKLAAIVRDQKDPLQRLADIDAFSQQLKGSASPEVEREIEQARNNATSERREAYLKEQQLKTQREEANRASAAENDQTAQLNPDEGEAEEDQVIPGVSPVFMAKLSAITDKTITPDEKLAEIDALVKSYGWPFTPPAIAKVVYDARQKIMDEKNRHNDQPESANDLDLSHKSEDDQLGTFMAFSGKFYVAQYCAENEAFFTSDDVSRLKVEFQKLFSSMTLSQAKRDAAWQIIQNVMPTQLAGMTAEECAAEKQSYLFMWPQIFAPDHPVENPF